ncbi:CTP synthetase [Maritimibacter sp. DP1N21-5]|uniref:CTP synthetase n=1 Tax=Maritimibacter sp. DP1N21-5 TaxID=2836867 RepID=UPI001C460740|nr:CTP synthetase [Maritimibacter sp. DP1N21-5]MBV7408029.1 CTP synthetase [Maritimibacter sp. DP1N21-5]
MSAPLMRLVLILHSMIGTTLAGVAVVVALVSGVTGLWPLVGAAAAGWLIGWPVAFVVAHRMHGD